MANKLSTPRSLKIYGLRIHMDNFGGQRLLKNLQELIPYILIDKIKNLPHKNTEFSSWKNPLQYTFQKIKSIST